MHTTWQGFMAAALAALALAAGQAASAQGHDLAVTRQIDAPPEEVWRALTEAEAIREWWGPTGFTAPVVEVDPRVGGSTLVCMQPPGGPPMCNSWTYTAIEPPSRLAFDQGWVDEEGRTIDPATLGLPPDMPAIVPHVIELRPLADGGTELGWSEFGYASPEAVAMSRSGLDQVLDKLAASLE